jgi:hypothetical protein
LVEAAGAEALARKGDWHYEILSEVYLEKENIFRHKVCERRCGGPHVAELKGMDKRRERLVVVASRSAEDIRECRMAGARGDVRRIRTRKRRTALPAEGCARDRDRSAASFTKDIRTEVFSANKAGARE